MTHPFFGGMIAGFLLAVIGLYLWFTWPVISYCPTEDTCRPETGSQYIAHFSAKELWQRFNPCSSCKLPW